MSTLTKVLIILIFLISAGTVAILATLYGQRVDWQDKFIKEVNQHWYTIQVLRAEAEAREVQIANKEAVIASLKLKVTSLAEEVDSKENIVETLNRQITDLSAKFTALLEHAAALNSNINQITIQMQELQNANSGLRAQRDQANSERQQAQAELFQLKGELETALKSLNVAEKEYIKSSRDSGRLEQIINRLRQEGVNVDVLPVPRLVGKVRGVAPELGLVVISVGKDEGVTPGMNFTIFRGPNFVCTISIDRVDRNWASGRIMVRQMDPRVGDDASNDVNRAGARVGAGQ